NSRNEKKVAESLKESGITSYVATQKEMKVWKNGKRKTIDRVVIPSVVFVHCTEKERRRL
ncbi:MAG: transcriptional regulator, partial [Muribaculaceae bacterium]|nr:transcriptional regulator [Muribaculaceae bacterium]